MNNNNQTTMVSDKPKQHFFRASASDFKKIPGSPIAYWISEKVINAFENESPLYENYPVKSGIMTGNDPLFLRLCQCPSQIVYLVHVLLLRFLV